MKKNKSLLLRIILACILVAFNATNKESQDFADYDFKSLQERKERIFEIINKISANVELKLKEKIKSVFWAMPEDFDTLLKILDINPCNVVPNPFRSYNYKHKKPRENLENMNYQQSEDFLDKAFCTIGYLEIVFYRGEIISRNDYVKKMISLAVTGPGGKSFAFLRSNIFSYATSNLDILNEELEKLSDNQIAAFWYFILYDLKGGDHISRTHNIIYQKCYDKYFSKLSPRIANLMLKAWELRKMNENFEVVKK